MAKRYRFDGLAAVVVATVATVAVALGSCAPPSGGSGDGTDETIREIGDESGLGAYLAGRFAQAHGDTHAAADYLGTAARSDRDNIELQQRAFNLLLAEGRLDEAAPMAERLLAIDEAAPMPILLVGVRDGMAGRFAAAETRFSGLPHKGINGFLGPLLTAWTQVGQGDYDGALKQLAPRADTAAFAPIYEFHAGLIADLAGRAEVAEGHYKAALSTQVSIRTIEAIGSFYQRAGRMDAAREVYERYHADQGDRTLLDGARQLAAGTALPPVVDGAGAGLAEVMFDTATLVRQGSARDLALVFVRLSLGLRPDFPLAQLLLADILGQQSRLVEANQVYRAIDRNSQAAAFARLKTAINLDEAGDEAGAVRELKALAADRPGAVDVPMTLGDVLRRHKRFAEAAEAYDMALVRAGASAESRNWAIFYARGIALERSHQWTRAEKDFLEALRLKPDQPDVLNYLGYTWVDQGINLEQGRKMIERAVQIKPNDGAIVDSLGWALYRIGDYAGAAAQLEHAVELKPEDPTINEHLGDALWQVGRFAEARFQWQRALSLDPEPEQLEALKAKVEDGQPPAKPAK